MSYRSYSLALLALMALPLWSWAAQEEGTGRPRVQPGQTTQERSTSPAETAYQPGTSQESNKELVNFLAGKLMLCNQMEIQQAQMAVQQCKNPEVKQFAQQLVQHHQQLNEQLKQKVPAIANFNFQWQSGRFGQQTARSGQSGQQQLSQRTQSGRSQSQDIDQQPQVRGFRGEQTGAGSQSFAGTTGDLMKIYVQAAHNHQEMTNNLLKSYEGRDFDKAFLGSQIGQHAWSLAELKAIQSVGPQELQQVASQAEQVVQQHFDTAKQLCERFENEQQSGASGQQDIQGGSREIQRD